MQVSRSNLKVMSELADKTEKFVQSEQGGVVKVKVEEELMKSPALLDAQAVEIARLLIRLEEELTKPQDFEWAIENGTYTNQWFSQGKFYNDFRQPSAWDGNSNHLSMSGFHLDIDSKDGKIFVLRN